MVRTPERNTCTGSACSASVIRMISALNGPRRYTWPSTPSPVTTGCDLKTPWFAPRLTSRRWRSVEVSTLMTSPMQPLLDDVGHRLVEAAQRGIFLRERRLAHRDELLFAQLVAQGVDFLAAAFRGS